MRPYPFFAALLLSAAAAAVPAHAAQTLQISKKTTLTTFYNGALVSSSFHQRPGNADYKVQLIFKGTGNPTPMCRLYFQDRKEALELYRYIKTAANVVLDCQDDRVSAQNPLAAIYPDQDVTTEQFSLR
jgi:hypothetical protein